MNGLDNMGTKSTKMKKYITLKDVARRAGISVSTVSKVVNNEKFCFRRHKRKSFE
ncbi:unnamed protein product, partial [marine sediment metagenome]